MRRTGSMLLLCLALSGCASSQWVGEMRRASRDKGEKLLDLPDKVAIQLNDRDGGPVGPGFELSTGRNVFDAPRDADCVVREAACVFTGVFGPRGLRTLETHGEFVCGLERRIEFIGDSITAGYGVEGSSPTCVYSPETENAALTYAAQTA